jgi:hypothetical protein
LSPCRGSQKKRHDSYVSFHFAKEKLRGEILLRDTEKQMPDAENFGRG